MAHAESFPANRPMKNFLTVVTVLVSSVITGLIAVQGNPLLLIILLSLFVGMGLMIHPHLLLWIVLFGGLVVSGLSSLYFPQLGPVRWGVVLATLGLGLSALLARGTGIASGLGKRPAISPTALWALIFFIISLLSALLNFRLSSDAVIGLKGYFQAWGILLAFALLPLRTEQADRYVRFLIILAMVQIPFALHQYLVLVPQRSTMEMVRHLVVAPDVVAGTFIASLTGGGGSAILAVLQVTAVAMVLSLWQEGRVTGRRAFLFSLLALLPLLFNEAKITFFLLPVALLLVFRGRLHRSSVFRIVGLGLAAVVVMAVLMVAYFNLSKASGLHARTAEEYLQDSVKYNLGQAGYGMWLLNRTTVYPFWASRHGLSDAVHTLVGHGPGCSKEGGGIQQQRNLAYMKYFGYGIGLTGVSSLLWDVGLLGAAAALMFFASVFASAGRLAGDARLGPTQRGLMRGAQVGIALIGVSLLHNNFFVFEIGFQTLLMLQVGYVMYWQRK